MTTSNSSADPGFLSVRCVCHSNQHLVHLDWFKEDPELCVSVYLSPYLGFWKRVWGGMKYIVGYKPTHSHWDSILVSVDDAKDIKDILDKFIAAKTTPVP